MNFTEDLDSKPLKKGKLGPLDIYPQEEKQREDELTSEFVRSGFRNQIPELLSEYEYQSIGKDQPISTNSNFDNDVIRVLLQIVNKKEESNVNSQIEASKKQSLPAKTSQSFRPSLILMTGNQKTKESAYAWFKQLANNEPLIKLAKKIPVFNKRADNLPEILITLYEYQVSISRSVWYLKIMVLGCTTNLTEANKKKRQTTIDVSSEWSVSLVRLLKEMFLRLQFYELSAASGHQHQSLPANMTLEGFMKVDNLNSILLPIINHNYLTEKKLKCLWTFTTKLTRAMLDQNLLDKQMILESLLDLLEKSAIQNRSAHINKSSEKASWEKYILTLKKERK
ncbi:mediator of RNA polymerase II transcription subunit 12 [Brachionus plicatilis]|uniref:Mediator of RNA polymerase II transcription subunit 12 n=1 Tax=Brachionus plicatilis TaxID=10195 RepID=A0A3M7S8K4_BRAPC|nr:mediator of RNA polymerase II transcription subunit 12 [Brachionus plicatilis]